MERSTCGAALAFVVVQLVTLRVYWPGLTGPFLLDDYANLASLSDFGVIDDIQKLLLFLADGQAGPGGRPLSMLSFLLNALDWPDSAWSFKYTGLLLHLLTGSTLCWLTFMLIRIARPHRLTADAAWIAVLSSSAWTLHPFFVSTTLYVIQRMTVLSTLFVLLGLLSYLQGRSRLGSRPALGYVWMTIGIVAGTLLAVLCKENGALLPVLVLVLEATVLGTRCARLHSGWYALFVLLPVALLCGYFAWQWEGFSNGYKEREFTLAERLLTECRIVWSYLYALAVPRVMTPGLYTDNFPFSTGLLTPITTLPAVIAMIGLIVAGFWVRRTYPFVALTILFFLAGHLLESTVVPLELYYEHRNYLPAVFLFLPLVVGLYEHLPKRSAFVLVTSAGLLVLASVTAQRTAVWGNEIELAKLSTTQNPTSMRAQRAAVLSLEHAGRPDLALKQIAIAQRYLPNHSDLAFYAFSLKCRIDRVDAKDIADILRAIATMPYDPKAFEYVASTAIWTMNGECNGPTAQDIFAIFDAILARGNAPRWVQTRIWHLKGTMYARLNDAQSSLRAFQQALTSEPEPQLGFSGVSSLANLGMYKEALTLLATVESMLKREDLSVKERWINGVAQYEQDVVNIRAALEEALRKPGDVNAIPVQGAGRT